MNMKFRPKITVKRGSVEGYGAPGYDWAEGTYDNRLLFRFTSEEVSSLDVAVHKERIKWEKPYSSKSIFLKKISKLPSASPVCSNCGEPEAYTSCLNKNWCASTTCREALEAERAAYVAKLEQDKIDSAIKAQQSKLDNIAKCDAAVARAFHWRDGWFFARNDDASVRVMHRNSPQSDWFAVDITIPAAEWASIVCSVSADGETSERWDVAQDFHGQSHHGTPNEGKNQ